MDSPRLRVAKIGGSLLDLPDLPKRIDDWLSRQASGPWFSTFLVGGGRLADAVRTVSERDGLSNETAHWLCIEAMRVQTDLLQPQFGIALIDPLEFMRNQEPYIDGKKLPHNWTVTSDSIAARWAAAFGAKELVLFKSRLPIAGTTRETLSEEGIVDPAFDDFAHNISRVHIVDLRHGGEASYSADEE